MIPLMIGKKKKGGRKRRKKKRNTKYKRLGRAKAPLTSKGCKEKSIPKEKEGRKFS